MKWIATALVSALFALLVTLIYLDHYGTNRSERLCTVLYGLIESSDRSLGVKGTPGYSYYHEHPDELRAAHRANVGTLKTLAC